MTEQERSLPTVWLVGAGPGDAGLLTVKGRQLLEQADVVIYDQLASPALLELVRAGAEKIDVGKKAGRHTLPQEKINALLVEKARAGGVVVRLKGGDPFVFGRGGEEAAYLVEKGCRYEVVPGVTSAVAVPAYAGIPVTHRDFTQSVTLITGHEAGESRLNWKNLADNDGTLVFLMGLGNLPQIAGNLIREGKSPDTPAAVISHGAQPEQKTVTAALADIAAAAEEAALSTPALIVVGEVVRLRESLQWLERKPLFGKKVLVTRSAHQAEELARLLRKEGAGVLSCPLIAIEKLLVPEQLKALLQTAYQWLVFTSVNGVELFFEALYESGLDARALGESRVAAIGSATAGSLLRYGIRADLVPEVYRAEDLAEALVQRTRPGEKILLPRALKARAVLRERLQSAGCVVDELPLYDTRLCTENRERLRACLQEADYITLTSSSTAEAFVTLAGEDKKMVFTETKIPRIACIGPVTAQTLAEKGLAADIVPEEYTIRALTEALLKDAVFIQKSQEA